MVLTLETYIRTPKEVPVSRWVILFTGVGLEESKQKEFLNVEYLLSVRTVSLFYNKIDQLIYILAFRVFFICVLHLEIVLIMIGTNI